MSAIDTLIALSGGLNVDLTSARDELASLRKDRERLEWIFKSAWLEYHDDDGIWCLDDRTTIDKVMADIKSGTTVPGKGSDDA